MADQNSERPSKTSLKTFEKAAKDVKFVAKHTKNFTRFVSERENLHRKTFTKWMNARLAQHDPPMEIKDIVADLMDGKMLLNLLEVLLNTTLRKEKGVMRVHKLNNVEKAMDLLEKQKVKLVGINGFDIVDGKPRAILALMWSVILRFQVQEAMQETVTEETAKAFNVEKKLLDWCKDRLQGYESSITITDFTTSWRDGLAFNALIHSYRPDLFNFDDLETTSTHARLESSFKMAEKYFGVPRYLDSSDIDVDKPDKKLIIMYLTEMYNCMEGTKARERKESAINDTELTVDNKEAVDGALNEVLDEMDAEKTFSQSEHDSAVDSLNEMLNEVESGLSDAEQKKPMYDQNDYVDLEAVMKQMEKQKAFENELETLKSRTYEVLDKGQSMIADGVFQKEEEEQFQSRMDIVAERIKRLLEQCQKDRDRLSLERTVLLKQQLSKMLDWLSKAEQKMKDDPDIGTNYETVNQQLEDHQKFQEEVGDVSMVTIVLGTDNSDPGLDDKTRTKVKDVCSRWPAAWNWCDDRNQKLTRALIDWQKFRDEELLLLNWLAQKEKTLKEVALTDVAEEEDVKQSLKLLEVTQSELNEQEQRLQRLHQLGEDIIEESGNNDEITKEIKAQLLDFDECWNHVATRTLDEKEKLINTQNKMKEMYGLMGSVNEWINETKGLMKEYNEDMPLEDQENLKKRAEMKLEEKPNMQVKVDRVNRLGKDVCEILDGPSEKAVKGELQEFNDRWQETAAALESYNDKGYPESGGDCCFMRIIKRKFKSFS
ncbi:utrophin-like isoform X1 [Acropora millepora]|uniref:utrophin-like isoform X1 n=1 Tax=Acropora millepora TaxID=45264 RepID=UPI001CF5B9F6|nr:utrophin-like isoform X1 [Acropora millepora]